MAEPYNPLIFRRCLLGATQETTAGTAATVTAPLSSTLVWDADIKQQDVFKDGERLCNGLYLGEIAKVPGSKVGVLTFRSQLRYGDANLAFLTACGFKLSASTYARETVMTNRKTYTFALWQDGRRKSIVGAVGTGVIEFQHGAPVWINWTFTGVWVAPTDDSMPADTQVVTLPWVTSAMTYTLNSATPPRHSKISVDLGNKVEPVEDVRVAGGIGYYLVADWQTRITLDPEARLVAQLDDYGLLAAATEHAFSAVVSDGTHTLTIAAPKCQRIMVDEADRGGKRIDNLTMQCNRNSGDDELTIATG